MPRFTRMLAEGMRARGHSVEIIYPKPLFFKLARSKTGLAKWLGYIDQFCVFPLQFLKRLDGIPQDTLFVITDHALGPWVPLVEKYSHVVHCHDFLAQLSAIGRIEECGAVWSGRLYQKFIRWGYSRARNFISVSSKTKKDLHHFIGDHFDLSEVVYNSQNMGWQMHPYAQARRHLSDKLAIDLQSGYILHVGGNQWYKNREGVIAIYDAWRAKSVQRLPLIMVGAPPSNQLITCWQRSEFKTDIHFISALKDEDVNLAYCGASLLLYPSLAEGFGWPIIEAMECGCPVITTGEAPMTEVGGDAACYIPKRPLQLNLHLHWASTCAEMVQKIVCLPTGERSLLLQNGFRNTVRFNLSETMDKLESIYIKVLTNRHRFKSEDISLSEKF